MCTPVNCVFLHVHRLNLRVFTAMKQLVKRVHLPKAKATAANASCFSKLTVTFCTCTKASRGGSRGGETGEFSPPFF